MLGWGLEGDDGQLGRRPGVEFRASLVPEFGNAAHQVAWLRVERLGVKPNQESLNDCVVHLRGRDALTSAPVGEGGEPVRQALVIGDGLEQRPPFWMASAATPARRLNDPGKLKRGSEQAPQVRVALGADAVGGWTNPREHLLQDGRLRSHGSGRAPAISQIRLRAEIMSRRRVPASPAWSMRPTTSASVATFLFSIMGSLSTGAFPLKVTWGDIR